MTDYETGNFPEATREAWLELVEETLAGRPFGTLTTTTLDGIEIQPLYDGEGTGETEPSGLKQEGLAWEVLAFCDVADDDLTAIAEVARAEMKGGANGIVLRLGGPVDADDLRDVISAIADENEKKQNLLAFEAGPCWQSAAFALAQLAEAEGVGILTGLKISLRADPIAALARHGTMGEGSLADLVVKKPAALRHVRTVGVDASVFSDAGASEAQEVACSLAAGVWHLRELAEAGVSIDAACAEMEFTYAATADQFATIAKLRAARQCWHRIAEASGASPAARYQRQHAVTSRSMLTRHDPMVNVLRSAVAAFAAGVAGVDSQCVLPYDIAIGAPSDDSRRLARNISHILIQESRIGHVADPARGSAYVQALTQSIAEKAWELFQQIEAKDGTDGGGTAEGGIVAALQDGTIGQWLENSWQQRTERIVRRKDPICGVSEFPVLDEPQPGKAAWTINDPNGLLPMRRLSEPFENLRDAVDESGTEAKVFLASLSSLAVDSPRLTFSENFLAAAGIASSAGSIAEFRDSGASAAVLCSSDAVYKEQISEAVAALREAGCEWIYLAGRPKGDLADIVEATGIDGKLYAGCDAVALLEEMLERLGIDTEQGVAA